MSVNALMIETERPSDERVKTALGPAWAHFEALRAATAPAEREWRYAGKKYGWKLKVHADDKTLLELTVMDGWCLVAMAMREPERKAMASTPGLEALAQKAAAEGWAVKLQVRDAASCEQAVALVQFVKAQRKLG